MAPMEYIARPISLAARSILQHTAVSECCKNCESGDGYKPVPPLTACCDARVSLWRIFDLTLALADGCSSG
jgi:hypothetical protein